MTLLFAVAAGLVALWSLVIKPTIDWVEAHAIVVVIGLLVVLLAAGGITAAVLSGRRAIARAPPTPARRAPRGRWISPHEIRIHRFMSGSLRGLDPFHDGVNSESERDLYVALHNAGLPVPRGQVLIPNERGGNVACADFAYIPERIAIFCDGHLFHSSREARSIDNSKRNELQRLGWKVLAFSGTSIYREPAMCVGQIHGMLQVQQRGITVTS